MPSEIPDGRDAGTKPTKLRVYMLSEEELVRYRGEEMMARMKRFEGRLPELLARFEAGDAETGAGKAKLAREFEVSVQTIYYHYNRWKASKGGQDQQQSETPTSVSDAPSADQAPESEAPPSIEAAVPESLPGARPGMEPEPNPAPAAAPAPPAVGGGSYAGYVQEESRQAPESESPAPKPRPVWPPNLCETCIKRDVCPVPDTVFIPPYEYDREHLPGKLRVIRIVVSARYVQECSAYHAG